MPIVLLHGWGFHAGLWREVAPRLAHHDPILINLGFLYGGPRGASRIPEDALCVGHSFGLLWLLKHGPRRVKGLVSVAGFDCLHAHVPAQTIQRMREGLDRDAAAQMRAFWRACGIETDEAASAELDTAALKAGLDWIASWDERESRRALAAPTLAIAAANDRIVPREASEAMWGDGTASLHWHETAGHGLPLTAPDWCAEHILRFVDDLGP